MATTTSMTEADWQTVQSLAQQVNFPAERVSLARKRLMAEPSRHGSPFTLVVGRPDAGIELVLARHFAPEVAEKLKESGERPLVLGPKPSEILPPFTSWPVLPLASLPEGHILALRIARRPDPGLLAQLGGLGYIDQLILVTRLGGPLHEQERDIARALVPLAATVRVLIVGLPGEEPSTNELAEVSAYAFAQMRQAGFRSGRCRSADIWFSGGPARPGTVPDLAKQFLNVSTDFAPNF